MADAKHVAVQGTLISVYDAIWIVLVAILNNRFSIFIRKGNGNLRQLLIQGTRIAIFLSPVFVSGMLALLFVLGADFHIGYYSASLYGLVVILHAYGFLLNRMFILKKKNFWVSINHCGILVLKILLNIFLIPGYAIQGSVHAILISISFVYVNATFNSRKKFEI